MNKTNIEWVKNIDGTQGHTWNPITGCLNHVNGMCKGGNFPCYAYKLANGRLKSRYLYETTSRDNVQTYGYGCCLPLNSPMSAYNDPFYPRFWGEKMPYLRRHPRGGFGKAGKGIFPCDMGDLFGFGVPEEWTRRIIDTIRYFGEHRFYLLTKQPQTLPQWSPFPANAWVGVTATDREQFTLATGFLANIQATVKFISFEPLLQRIILPEFGEWGKEPFDWLIIGAQTRPYKPPKIEWVREIVRACDKAKVPVFLKDNLKPLFGKLTIDDKWAWAKDLGYGGLQRQEMPRC